MVLTQKLLQKRYVFVEAQPISTPGIYHNPDLGLISLSSDGTNWTTIADKNLGATQVYNDGDTLSEANCGKYYQWGNNYGFPFTGTVTTSSTQVDASTYGPGNYYSSSTFITTSGDDWSSVQNNNLWGGETGTVEAMQGPAPTGFHVPTDVEFGEMETILNGIGITTGANIKKYLKIPFSGFLHYASGNASDRNTMTYLWSCIGLSSVSWLFQLYDNTASTSANFKSVGCPIRPFKNTPVQPDDSWTVLYQQ